MIVIIDYGVGNLGSVANALRKLNLEYVISGKAGVIAKSDRMILPGVGAASEGMKNLKKTKLDQVIINEIIKGKPILGICLGMQLFFGTSEEGKVECLNIFPGKVVKFKRERKVPQIGWNKVSINQYHNVTMKQLFRSIPDNSYFYFVNSYYCVPNDKKIISGITEYGEEFASVVIKDNILGTQFHPEKSGKIGMKLLKNWSSL
jgi:imidazole glycerol-phosphate synthase subunit HisH